MMNEQELRLGIATALAESAGELTVDDVIEGLARNEYALLEFTAGFLVICTIDFPAYRALKVCIAYGLINDEQPFIMNLLEALAKDLGCSHVMIEGRRGWARQLAQFGYAEQYVVVTKKVEL